jgi:hypothetical protein
MINYELTDQLIELENIQKNQFFNRARGQQATEILSHYALPENYFTLKKEIDTPHNDKGRRTIVLFNFGNVQKNDQFKVIECLFFLGHTPDFIAEAMSLDLKYVAQSLINVITESRARHAADLRNNPQRFRLVKDNSIDLK